MPNTQRECGNNNQPTPGLANKSPKFQQPPVGIVHLHSLKTNKQPLVRNEIRAPVSLAQLVRSVDGPAQNQDDCQSQKRQEQPHSRSQGLRAGMPSIPHHVVCKGDDEDENHNDLQHQARHCNVDSRIARPLGLSGQRTARGLQREAYQIGGDEDPIEELGVEPRELRREVVDAEGAARAKGLSKVE